MSKRVVWVVVVVLVLALGLGGGLAAALLVGGDDEPSADRSPSSAAPSTSGTTEPTEPVNVPEGLEEFYGQQLAWSACGSNECAAMTVPLDYAEPEGETIELQLQRVPAGDQENRVGSLVVNPGGPGAAGTSMAESADYFFRPQLLERVDVVAFDPRGTGGSAPIDCLPDDELDAFIAADPAPDDDAEVRATAQGQEEFFAGCEELSGDLVGHVSTVEAARDLDVMRGVLGEEKLSYLGFSYGTTLGSTYAELFPDNVGRFVLDGATDPTLDARADALSQAAGFQTAIEAYVQDCVDDGDCFLGDSLAEGLGTVEDLLDSIDEQPLETSLGRTLEVGNAFYGVVAPLYNEDNWTYLDQGLQSALAGDGTILLSLSDSYSSRNSTGDGYLDNQVEANLVINCLDDPTALEPEQVADEIPAFLEASPTFGEVFAWGQVGCRGITVEASEPTPEIDAEGAAPIVVLGTTRDPATPYQEAVALAEQLASGVLVSRDGDGHTAYNKGNACIDEAVEGYLLDGTVPDDGLEC